MNLNRLRSSVPSLNGAQVRTLAPLLGLLVLAVIAIPLLLGHSGRAAAVAPLPPTPTVTAPAPGALVAVAPPVHANTGALHGPAHNPFVQKTAPTTGSSSHTIGSSTPQTATLSAPAATSSSSTAGAAGQAASSSATTTVTHTVTVTVPASPTGAGQEGPGSTSHATDAQFCATHRCIKSFSKGHGKIVQCRDGMWSHSGGLGKVCSDHQGPLVSGSAPSIPVRVTNPSSTSSSGPSPAQKNGAANRYRAYRPTISISRPGSGKAARVIHAVARDQLLPSDHQALATFLGVRQDARTAVFILPGGVTVHGHGTCSPSTVTCTYLLLNPHQQADITAPADSQLAGTWVLRYVGLTTVTASGNIANVDHFGASAIKRAAAYVPHLKTVHYGHLTGLLQITLGTLQKVGL